MNDSEWPRKGTKKATMKSRMTNDQIPMTNESELGTWNMELRFSSPSPLAILQEVTDAWKNGCIGSHAQIIDPGPRQRVRRIVIEPFHAAMRRKRAARLRLHRAKNSAAGLPSFRRVFQM
jgi:hypothetical protein